ncbi:extracellular solute-binding protein [Candidatus Parcubacteria bacterium]|nr:MAG: extracellular solute-binding protein [Candidatus Parcubacteria bacterium]
MPKLSVFQAVLLGVFGALAISGVLIFALVVGGNAGSSTGPVIIWGTFDESAFRVVLRQAAEKDDRLMQVTYVQKDPLTYNAELTEALASGTGPDLFFMRQDYAVRDKGKVFPIPYDRLSREQFQGAFVESADPYLSAEGILAFPVLVDPFILYWNKDMLSTAGYANPPQYWDEITGMAKSITKRNDAGQILKSTISFGEYRNVNYAKEILSLLVLQAGGEVTATDTTGRLVAALVPRSGERTQAAESALRFYTGFADPSQIIYSWSRAFPESRAAFGAGDLALYVGLGSEKTMIARTNPNLNFATAPMPQIRTAERSTDAAYVYGVAVSRATKNPTGSVIVASILAGAEVSEALSIVYGMPSAHRDVLSKSATGDELLLNRQAIISRAWTDPDPEKTNDVFRAMIENVTSGTLRLPEAVSRAHQELGQLLQI